MERKSVFTSLTKYSFIGVILVIILAGCQGANGAPISADSPGFFDHYFVYPFSVLIKGLASILNGDFGLSIIVITLLVRLVLMPLMLKQMKNSTNMQEKMKVMKPEMDAIQEKYKGKKDKESQMKMQQETMQLYQKHQMNPLASLGCLPMIIQFPIFIGLYYAIRRTPEIATHNFLWFNLGQTDVIMPFIAAAVYLIQAKVSQIGMDPKQKKQMALFSFISPIMIFIVSFNFPAALPLYWIVSGSFLVLQTLISKKLYLKKAE
ncbi:membrane protein insertase YidC [Virgibacillus dakarensis]|uniref:Membrane protein insertase YidC n=1 Tax=Lentibacillus populi TaxID=1827502 RepID=A0A9W5U1R0_9BACI|nr:MULTISPECIES: membrane protein insertase YidC [Bacillaceae]MBT2216421.1 membrane protein insertase YidC [Virgibacillus dakarensis]MTW85883.1 membrane protein insertase YidC [Virgibacillus dakarensis]GGB61607.1 membrane protein insertase MisCB [Lentibacillus populi]